MNVEVCIILAALLLAFGSSASAQPDVYIANPQAQNLTVSWLGGSTIIEGVVGTQGENTSTLVTFDGSKALRYENLASRSAFEAYFTLSRRGNDLLVDCIYTNVRNERNGILINKAVCGLDRPLTEDYEELVYEFTDAWKRSTAEVNIDTLLKAPAEMLEVGEADFGDVKFSRVYKAQADLSTTNPEAVISKGEKRYSFATAFVFLVYKFGNLDSPAYLKVSSGEFSKGFVKYDGASLNNLLW